MAMRGLEVRPLLFVYPCIDEEICYVSQTSKDDEIEICFFDVHVLGQFGVL